MAELSGNRIAHLGMIQDLITRIAGESARMKQFALAALGVLAATSEATDSAALAYVAGVLAIVFWLLDARYLAQEREYRRFYNEVRGADGPTDFRMTLGADIPSRNTIAKTAFAWSVAPLYGTIFVIALVFAHLVSR